MKIQSIRALTAALILVLFCPALPAEQQSRENRTIVQLVTTLLLRQHYIDLSSGADEAANSERFFKAYLEALDPQHLFFTADQVERWGHYRHTALPRLLDGDASAAFGIYGEFLKRLRAYDQDVQSLNFTDSDFSGNDEYTFDRTKAPWAANEAELRKIWHSKIKNDVLILKMLQKSESAEAASPAKNAKNGKAAKAWKPLPPMVQVKKRVDRYVREYEKFEQLDVLELYLNAFAGLFDPHTAYMAPRSEEDFNIAMRLSLVGIGAVLTTSEEGYVRIVQIVPGGPADRDGRLKADDRIIAVTQEHAEPVDVVDMPLDKVVGLIRGEKDTEVTLTILSGSAGAAAAPRNITIRRDRVALKESEAKSEVRLVTLPDGSAKRIGIISLPSFYADFEAAGRGDPNYKSSTRDVENLISSMSKPVPPDCLVIDLRTNGGGSLREAVTLTGLFIPRGPVVQIRGQAGRVTVEEDRDGGKVAYRGPLLVLTNKFSASASEIFAGAIRDYDRGIIVGDAKTHGKGTVQTIVELDPYLSFLGRDAKAGSLKITNAKFYRINGDSTQLRGVHPDIVFPSFTDSMDIGEDKLSNPMKWDSLDPARGCVRYDCGLPDDAAVLRGKSASRIGASSEFRALAASIARYKANKAKKTVSLNFSRRWNEYSAEKNMLEEQMKLLKMDSESEKSKSKTRDIFLEETVRIAADYAVLKTAK